MINEQTDKQIKEMVENDLQLEEIKFQPTMSTNPEYLKKLISRTFLKKSKHAGSRSLAAKAKVAKRKAKRKN
jgi:hypothetical protein